MPAVLGRDEDPGGEVGTEAAQSEQQILERRRNALQGGPWGHISPFVDIKPKVAP